MFKLFLSLLLGLFLSGCVHDVSVAPELSKIKKVRPVTISSSVAYYIPKETLNNVVLTPGGNNDRLRYSPYKESEPAFNKVLDNVFTKVYKISSFQDPLITEKKVQFIFVPTIETASYSNSNVDWEPTKFTYILDVNIYRPNKELVFKTHAQGKGIANFGRYQENPAYAVEIASRSALLQFQDEIITKRAKFK